MCDLGLQIGLSAQCLTVALEALGQALNCSISCYRKDSALFSLYVPLHRPVLPLGTQGPANRIRGSLLLSSFQRQNKATDPQAPDCKANQGWHLPLQITFYPDSPGRSFCCSPHLLRTAFFSGMKGCFSLKSKGWLHPWANAATNWVQTCRIHQLPRAAVSSKRNHEEIGAQHGEGQLPTAPSQVKWMFDGWWMFDVFHSIYVKLLCFLVAAFFILNLSPRQKHHRSHGCRDQL